jgi:hypothetical protein
VNSRMEGSFVASDVRRDAGGDKYPSSAPEDGIVVTLPLLDERLYVEPKSDAVEEVLEEAEETVEAAERCRGAYSGRWR